MKKKIISLIYRLPIIRGIIKRLNLTDKQLKDLAVQQQQNCATIKKLQETNNTLNNQLNECKNQLNESRKKNEQLNKELQTLQKKTQDNFETNKAKNSELRRDLTKEMNYLYYKGLTHEQYEKNIKEWFYYRTGQHLNLDNPQTYNEKIQWMKLYDSTPEKTRLADKYLVREFVKEKIGEEYLVPLLGVWDRFKDINFDELPNQFVLKANHGCAWNIIVPDKSKFKPWEAEDKFRIWMQQNYAHMGGFEMHYANIQPKIIAEEYIENIDGDVNDYKIFCFNGKAHYIMFLTERKKGLKMAFYDREWNRMPFVYSYPQSENEIPKPDNLDEMLLLAEKLSEGFSHVRVDFYLLNDGSIKFGEMTFTSASGTCMWNPPEYNRIMGDLIELDLTKRETYY